MDVQATDNFRKHTSNNPLQKLLINNFFNTFLSEIKDLKVESILDVGCGEGFTLQKLYENKIGKKLVGIDHQEIAIDIGKKIHPKLKLETGDIYHLPFKAGSFDLIICTEVLEHLEDPKKALKELARVPKKYLMLSVPNEPYFMLANFLRGKNITRWGNDIEHINHWTSKGFQRFAEKEDLKVISKRYPFPWTLLLLGKLQNLSASLR